MPSLRDTPAAVRRVLTERHEEVARLLQAVEETVATADPDPQRAGGTASLDELQQLQIASDTARRRRRELLRIEAALQRLETEEYGQCLACGAAIPEARLELDPAAVLCLACATRA